MTHSATFMPRRATSEKMDAPSLPPAAHLQALAGLHRINRLSHAAHAMLLPILTLARRQRLIRIRLLDIACGGGDVALGLAAAARRRGLQVDLTVLDRSPTALDQAARRARRAAVNLQPIQGDATTSLPDATFDVVTCSLFLHHLSAAQVVALLAQMRSRAARQIVISDLRRSPFGLALAWAGCRVLSRSPIVHFDGPASVRAAWRIDELAAMAAQAGLPDARIHPGWPWRMLLVWENPRPPGRRDINP